MTTDSAVLCRCLDTVIELLLKLESRGAQAETAVVGVPRERNVGVHCFQNFATLFSFVPKKNWPPVFGPTPKGQDQFAPTYSQRHRKCDSSDGAMRRQASCAGVAGDESDCASLAQPPGRLARHHGRQHHHGKNRSGIFSRLCQAWLRCLRWLAYCRCDHDHEPVGAQWAVHYGGNGQTVQRKLDVHVHGAEQRVSDGSRSVGYQLLLWGVRVARLHIHGSGSGNMHHL